MSYNDVVQHSSDSAHATTSKSKDPLFQSLNDNIDSNDKETVSAKKKRRVISWSFDKKFNNSYEANAALKEEGIWSSDYTHNSEEGQKKFYRCNKVKRRGRQCAAKVHLLFDSISDTVRLYRAVAEHNHENLDSTSNFGLSEDVKLEINKLFDLNMKPRAIMHRLTNTSGIKVPKMTQVRNYLSVLRRLKKYGDLAISLRELKESLLQMPRSKLGIKRPRINSEDFVAAANKCISGELSINESARIYNISKTTLARHVQSFRKSEATEFSYNPANNVKQVFSREEEVELKTYLLTAAARLHHGLSKTEIRSLAYQYAIANEKSCPLSWTKMKIAGEEWLRQFLRRHGDLSFRIPEFTTAGSTSFKANVASFFKNYKELLPLINYNPQKIWNCYEFGLTTLHFHDPPTSLGPKGIKQIGQMISEDRGQNITLIASVNATGSCNPPMIIFPRAHFEPRMLKGSPIGTIGGASPSGWSSERLFLDYLMHFKNYAKPSVEDPVILLLDNHDSYVNISTLDFCKTNGIHMITFYPHTSGKMQPLGRTVSGPMKTYYNTACSKWMIKHPGQPITIYDIAELIGCAFPKVFSKSNIRNGFKLSGIYPANENIFEDHEFLSADATGRPLDQSNEPHERLDIEEQKGEQDSYEDLPCEVSEATKSAIYGLIPTKSVRQYESAYKDFKEWCDIKKLKNVSENVILAFFEYKTKKVQPTTLWSIYSMLKRTLKIKRNVDIEKYPKLVPYLKHKCVGYLPKKSKVLAKEEIETFLREAPDDHFLLMKVILIFGIYGACRRSELLNLTVDDIEDKDSIVIVKIQDSPIHTQRTFIISNLKHIKIYRKYLKLRPKFVATRRFFIRYVNGKCVNQVVGINKIRNTPKEIAAYLKLPEPESYTGHCFRKSSATLTHDSGIGSLLADSGLYIYLTCDFLYVTSYGTFFHLEMALPLLLIYPEKNHVFCVSKAENGTLVLRQKVVSGSVETAKELSVRIAHKILSTIAP